MARIRQIKPEFWDSPSTASASAVARLLYIAMWNWADDSGHGTGNLKELEGFAFPNDDVAELSGGKCRNFRDCVTEVCGSFGVVFYNVRGRLYYEIPSWQNHQRNERLAKGKHPLPEEGEIVDMTGNPSAQKPEVRRLSEVPQHDDGSSDAVSGVQGVRGSGVQGVIAAEDPAPATPVAAGVTPDDIAKFAYDSTSGALKYMAIKGLAKWAIESKHASPDQIKASVSGLYEMGKPITKATLGQHLDGHIRGNRTRPATEDRMADILAIGENLDSTQRQIGA